MQHGLISHDSDDTVSESTKHKKYYNRTVLVHFIVEVELTCVLDTVHTFQLCYA